MYQVELEDDLPNTNVYKSNTGTRTPENATRKVREEGHSTQSCHVSLLLFHVFYASTDFRNYMRKISNSNFGAMSTKLIAESFSTTGTKQMTNWKSSKQR